MESKKEIKFKMKAVKRINNVVYSPSNPMPDKMAASFCLTNPNVASKLFESYPKSEDELKSILEHKPKRGRPKKEKKEEDSKSEE